MGSLLHASIVHFAGPSAECPVVFNCVLIGPFAHVVDACVPYCKALQNNRQLNYIVKYDVNWIDYIKRKLCCVFDIKNIFHQFILKKQWMAWKFRNCADKSLE